MPELSSIAWVNSWSQADQRLALDCVFDSDLLAQNCMHDLCTAAAMDSEIQRYLLLLCQCHWDQTWALLKWQC
jgi:hypothetical protein